MIFALRRERRSDPGYTLNVHSALSGVGATALAPAKCSCGPTSGPARCAAHARRDCLQIIPEPAGSTPPSGQTGIDEQPPRALAGVDVVGCSSSAASAPTDRTSDQSSSLVAPGGTAQYTLYAEREGDTCSTARRPTRRRRKWRVAGRRAFFGAVIVEPASSEWYRSQVTTPTCNCQPRHDARRAPDHQLRAVYPVGHPRAGLPILQDDAGNQIVSTDLTR